MAHVNVVVLGAGVIGLTSAALLSENPNISVTVIAKHMPGDYDIDYASPWAGANYLPTGALDAPLGRFERATWPHLNRLASELPEAGVHFQHTTLWNRSKDVSGAIGTWQRELLRTDPWYKDVVPDFKVTPQSELPQGIDSATSFTSVCINTAIYLPWLASRCLKHRTVIRRGIVNHVSEAADLHASGKKADIVINCTGLGAAKLGGVQDATVHPARGQIVLVRNDPGVMTSTSGTDDASDEVTYIMHRAAGGGTILGGSYQKGQTEPHPDMSLATRIMKRCVELCPALTDGKGIEALSIIRHGVGLRPLRDGGPRVEIETIQGQKVVHAYGHGGAGYQASWGTAEEVFRLVEESVGTKAEL